MPNIEFQAISRWFGLGFILVRKRLDLRHVLDVHFGRKAFRCLDTYKFIFGDVIVLEY